MMYQILTVLGACVSATNANNLVSRQSCSSDFNICAPAGTTSSSLGPISSNWADLYMSIVNVVSDYAVGADPPTTTTIDPNGPARREQAFCCEYTSLQDQTLLTASGSNVARCLVVNEYHIAMCWVSVCSRCTLKAPGSHLRRTNSPPTCTFLTVLMGMSRRQFSIQAAGTR